MEEARERGSNGHQTLAVVGSQGLQRALVEQQGESRHKETQESSEDGVIDVECSLKVGHHLRL